MEEFRLEPTKDGEPAISFTGAMRAEVDSKRPNSYRWTVLRAYETEGGSWILEEVGETTVEGERRFVTVGIHESREKMAASMGTGRLAMKMFKRLGLAEVRVR